MQIDSTRIPYFPENLKDFAPWVAKHGLVAPYGKCQCGCGEDVPIAPISRAARGWTLNHPTRFSRGHRLPKTHGVDEKQCSRCNAVKPLTEYLLIGSGRAGYTSHCKACLNAYYRRHYRANSARINARNEAYYNAHKPELLAYFKRRYVDHREQISEKRKIYYAKNRQKIVQYNRELARTWRAANPERSRAKVRNRRALRRAAPGTHTDADVKRQYEAQKGRCYYCGVEVSDKYHVDHVIPLSRCGSNGPENIVIACPFCNQSKGDKLPHEWPQGGRLL